MHAGSRERRRPGTGARAARRALEHAEPAQTPNASAGVPGEPGAYAKTPSVSNFPFSTVGESLNRSHSSIIVA